MASFKVGQRVRIRQDARCLECPYLAVPRGQEATIVVDVGYDWYELDLRVSEGPVNAHSSALQPITDPGFDAFMERVKKPVTLDEPVTV